MSKQPPQKKRKIQTQITLKKIKVKKEKVSPQIPQQQNIDVHVKKSDDEKKADDDENKSDDNPLKITPLMLKENLNDIEKKII